MGDVKSARNSIFNNEEHVKIVPEHELSSVFAANRVVKNWSHCTILSINSIISCYFFQLETTSLQMFSKYIAPREPNIESTMDPASENRNAILTLS